MLFEILIWTVIAIAVGFIAYLSSGNFRYRMWQWQKAHKSQFVKNKLHGRQWGVVWAVCTREAFNAVCLKRENDIKSNKRVSKYIEVPGATMTFTDMDGQMDQASYTTGTLHDMEHWFKDCEFTFDDRLYVPLASNDPNDVIEHRVTPDKARRIIWFARPNPIRDFLRRQRGAMVVIAVVLAMVAILIAQIWYSDTAVIPREKYAVGYYTRYGYIPRGRSFEELKADPAVWGIIWTEKTNDPNIELWYDWQCDQGFFGNSCEFVSYGRRVDLREPTP